MSAPYPARILPTDSQLLLIIQFRPFRVRSANQGPDTQLGTCHPAGIAALGDAELDIKVMIGWQIDEQISEYTGADACGRDAMVAVPLPKTWA